MAEETTAPREGLKAATEAAQKEQAKEFRRSLEMRTSFYEKLCALDAGSIAVAASVGMAIVAKPELRSGPHHANISWLAGITVSLWFSLVCAVAHNFVVLSIAKLESSFAEAECHKLATLRDLGSPAADLAANELLTGILKETVREQRDSLIRRMTLNLRATALGYLSIGSFLAAYTLVVACVLRLWWAAR
jgi:hypothetical protein